MGMTTMVGIGAVTGYGWGREALWRGVMSGKSAAELVDGYGRGCSEPGWVVRVPEGGRADDGGTRYVRAMRWAAREAIENARERGWTPGRRVGLVHAYVLGDPEQVRASHPKPGDWATIREYLGLVPSTSVTMLLAEFGFQGPAMNVSAMCTSGSAAFITAKSWLDTDVVDDVVVVATDLSATPGIVGQFERLRVAITDVEPASACRPFQTGTRGFVYGEAAVGYVLSNRLRGSGYATLLGGAMTHDAHHVTSIDPSLCAVVDCFETALHRAGVEPDEVAYLNAHGPGTKQCDGAESAVLERLFPSTTQIYSVKPLTGHCQAAAAAVEVGVAALATERGIVPAPQHFAGAVAHPQLLDGPTATRPGYTVKSSLGMGGHNAVLVLGPGE
ncbi:MAG TPA: beta-ketoacyl synthase N-terminal-like domain-containing protein [Aldersonia sp.]